jgi:hypothetical protein
MKGLNDERAAFRGAEVDDAADEARKDFFCRWNACVVPDLAIGDAIFTDVDEEFENFKLGGMELPALFERDAEPTVADIILRPEIERCVHRQRKPTNSSFLFHGVECVQVTTARG